MATDFEDSNGQWLRDKTGFLLLVRGTTVPTDATSGYAVGCTFIDTDATAPGSQVFINQGTTSSCLFRGLAPVSGAVITAATSTNITSALHAGRTVLMTGTGSAFTEVLPAATGTGAVYTFVVGAVNTSGDVISCVAAAATFFGNIFASTDDPSVLVYAAAAGNNVITLNGTTKGGSAVGDQIVIRDIATAKYQVLGFTTNTGTEASPFSTT